MPILDPWTNFLISLKQTVPPKTQLIINALIQLDNIRLQILKRIESDQQMYTQLLVPEMNLFASLQTQVTPANQMIIMKIKNLMAQFIQSEPTGEKFDMTLERARQTADILFYPNGIPQ